MGLLADAQLFPLILIRFLLLDIAVIRHGLQDEVAPFGYFAGVGIGVEALRGLDHARQHCCLWHRELRGVGAKIGAGCGLDAIGMVTKRHQVEIVGEDVILI